MREEVKSKKVSGGGGRGDGEGGKMEEEGRWRRRGIGSG